MLTMHVHADCYLHVAHLFVVNFTFKLALDRESQVMHANQQHARALLHAVVRLHICSTKMQVILTVVSNARNPD